MEDLKDRVVLVTGAAGGLGRELVAAFLRAGANVPLGRLVEPSKIAQAILFLASDASSYMTGTEILLMVGIQRNR